MFAAAGVDAVSDVFVHSDGVSRRLTSFADTYRAVAKPNTWERFAVPCTDGSGEIDAWIMRPTDFDSSSTYPVLLNVHGGPHTQYGESFFDEAQIQAAAGFVVIMSNPRGGSGREQSWGQSILGPRHQTTPGSGWGSIDVDDVLAVLDAALLSYPYCDADRVGMIGGSYGGFMATWLAGCHSDRFKAICSERAVNNMITEEFTSDIATIFRVEVGPNPIDAPEEYVRISPIRFVRDITVPMLIIHSENDLRCPINQAEELFVAMRLLGKDVTFYRFPGEGHELSRSGSPIHRRRSAPRSSSTSSALTSPRGDVRTHPSGANPELPVLTTRPTRRVGRESGSRATEIAPVETAGLVGEPGVDQLASDRDRRRNVGKLIATEPLGVDDLGRVDLDLARLPVGGEPDHQAVRERPWLATPVTNVADLDADLFADLALDGTFQGLARFDEAGQAAVHRGCETALRAPVAPGHLW